MYSYKTKQQFANNSKVEVRHVGRRKIWSHLLIIFVIFAIGAYVALRILQSVYNDALEKPNSDITTEVEFVIDVGETPDQIFSKLTKLELINEEYRNFFKYYLRDTGLGATIQAGNFRIPQNLTMVELVETLQKAGINDMWVTIPEGLRIDEIAGLLQASFDRYDNSVFSADEFIRLTEDPTFMANYDFEYGEVSTMEGYVFADRYLVAIESETALMLDTMLNNFITKVGSDITYEQLIIASMVEREANTEYDRKMVADIINRRYEEGWKLGIDATLLYYYQDWKHELTYADLNFDHPYNTRLNTGLVPTPICNPSLSSLKAVLDPEPNDYYYYITGNDGNFYYAKTLEEHNRNISQYLK